jgi:tRNA A37 threonylcarbamoyladenosine synthetase subunit TsaC/SUA5/YrdC
VVDNLGVGEPRVHWIEKLPVEDVFAADVLEEGGVAAVHSDLGYLVCANALDRDAVQRAVSAAGGGRSLPFGIIAGPDVADRFAVVGRRARWLMSETWPGTFALRLPRRRTLPTWVADEAITVLCPDAYAASVARLLGAPIATIPLSRCRRCPDDLEPLLTLGAVDLVVAGGSSAGVAATVLDLTVTRPVMHASESMFEPARLRRLVPDLS